MKGKGYKLSNIDMVYYVDAYYPHATVDEEGNWYADDDPDFEPVVGPRKPDQTAIAFSGDRLYFPGLMAALSSVKAHHPEVPLVIIDCGLTANQARYLKQFAEVVRSSNPLPDIPAWARFDVSLLSYDRIVYLDADVVVLSKIPDLLETEAEFAAVKNLDWSIKENFIDVSPLRMYGIDPEAPAFNAGVFSIDNRVWGKRRLFEKAMEIHSQVGKSFAYADQSALQIIMNSGGCRVTFLDDAYNAIAECWDWATRESDVHIIHFAGDEIKPWNPSCKYPMLDRFFAHSKIRRL